MQDFSQSQVSLSRQEFEQLVERQVQAQTAALRYELEQLQQQYKVLAQAEGRYRSLVTALTEGVWVTDATGAILSVNPALQQLIGVSEADLLGHHWLERVHPDDRDRVTAAWAIAVQQRQLYEIKYRLQLQNGTDRELWFQGVPVTTADGNLQEWVGACTDVVVDRQSEQRYRQTVENSPNPIFAVDSTGAIASWNHSCEQLLGYTQEIIGQPIAQLLAGLDATTVTANLAQVFAGDSLSGIEMVYRSQSGALKYMISRLYPVRDATGQIMSCVFANTDISEAKRNEIVHKQIEADLATSEARFRSIFEQAAVGMVLVAPTGQFLKVNQCYCDITGYSAAELLTLTDRDITHPASLVTDEPQLQQLFHGEITNFSTEKRYIRKDGQDQWVNVTASLIRDSDGVPLQTVAIVENIQARKQVEARLRQKEAQYRSIFESVTDALHVFDLETGALIEANPAACKMHGYLYEEFLQLHPTQFIHPDSLAKFGEFVETVQAGREFYSTDEKNIHRDGHVIEIEVKGVRFAYNGKPHILSIVRNITAHNQVEADRQQAAAELVQTRRFLELMLENLPIAVVAKEVTTHRYVLWNAACQELLGYPATSILGKTDHELFLPEQADFFIAKDQEAIDQQQLVKISEETIQTWDGRLKTLRTQKTPILDATGQPEYLLIISEDVTEQRQAEEALRQSEARFQKLAANMPGIIYRYVLHPDGADAFTYVSPGCRDLWGIEPAAAMQNATLVWQLVHPDDLAAFQASVAVSLQTMQTWQCEHRVITPKGQVKWCQGIARPERQPNGDIVWDGLLVDVSDRHAAVESLRLSEARFRNLVQDLQVGVVVHGANTEIYLCNPKALSLLGLTEDQLLSRTAFSPGWNAIHADGSPLSSANHPVAQAIATHQTVRGVVMGVTRPAQGNGSRDRGWLLVDAEPQLDSEGNLLQVICTFNDITARIKAETALKQLNEELETRVEERTAQLQESQRFIQSLADSTPSILYVYDLVKQCHVYVNREITTILGYTPDEIQAMGSEMLPKLLHSTDWANMPQHILRFANLPEGEIIDREVQMLAATGQWRTLFFRETVFNRAADGQVRQVLGVATDITDRKQAESALQKKEAMLRQVTDTAPGIVYKFELNPQGQMQFVYVSKQSEVVLGCTPEQMMNDFNWMWNLIVPEDQVRMVQSIALSAQTMTPWFEEYRIHKDGELRWIQGRSLPSSSESDGTIAWTGILIDVTDRKQIEAALQQNEAMLRQVTDTAPGVVFKFELTAAGQMRFIYASKQSQVVLGCTPEQLVEDFNWLWDVILPTDQARMAQSTLFSAQTGTPWFEEFCIHRDGQLRWIQGRSLPSDPQPNGSVTWSGILIDVTDRKQVEEQLKTSLEEKELLLKEVHHRVKNNLQVVSSLFSLQSQYIDDQRILEVLIDSQNRISAMALIHEKLYQSTTLAKVEFIDYLRNLTNSLFASYSVQAQRVKLQLNVDEVALDIDTSIRCGLIINELVSNALKHAFPGDRDGKITLELTNLPHNKICLTVQGNGVGLSPEIDLDQTNSLGLRLVRILSRKLKGNLSIISPPGTTFRIVFSVKTPVKVSQDRV